jgi:hypothetical protein
MVPFMFNLAILPERHDYRNRFILKFLVFENSLAKIKDGSDLLAFSVFFRHLRHSRRFSCLRFRCGDHIVDSYDHGCNFGG